MMRSTAPAHSHPGFLGVDLTDRYARTPRPIDVCSLDNELIPTFWTWHWTKAPEPIDLSAILGEIREARSVMIDGPQGLARPGQDRRFCEQETNAPGRTPDVAPQPNSKPFAGFIRSSLELFQAIHGASVTVSPNGFQNGVSEVFPGDAFLRLAPLGTRLPTKKSVPGRQARSELLQNLGLRLPQHRLLGHDQLDACLAALIAAAACGAAPGLKVDAIGLTLKSDADGTLREGPMVRLTRTA